MAARDTHAAGRTHGLRGVGQNFAVLAATTLLGQGIGFVMLVVIAHRVTPEQLGAWYFATNLASYFQIPTVLGMQTLATRDIAREPARVRRITGEVLTWQITAAVVAYVILYFVARPLLSPTPLAATLIPVAGLYFVIGAGALDWGLQAIHRGAVLGVAQLGGQLGYAIVLVATLSHSGSEMTHYAWANVFGLALAAGLTGIAFVYLRGWPVPVCSARTIYARAMRSLPFAASIMLVQVYWALGPVLLGLVGTISEAGEFGVALRLPQALVLLSRIWINTVYPHSSRVARDSPTVFARQIEFLTRLGITLGVPLVIMTSLVASDLMAELFGPQYRSAGPVFAMLTGLAAVLFVSANLANSLLALNLERTYMRFAVAGFAACVVLNCALIPTLGAIAPALALLAAELSVGLLAWRRLRGHLPDLALRMVGLGRVAVALGGAVALMMLLDAMPAAARLAVGATVFVALGAAIKAFDGVRGMTDQPA